MAQGLSTNMWLKGGMLWPGALTCIPKVWVYISPAPCVSCRVFCPEGVIASYLHSSPAAGLGRIGCLVALSSPSGTIAQPAAESLQVLRLELCKYYQSTSKGRPEVLQFAVYKCGRYQPAGCALSFGSIAKALAKGTPLSIAKSDIALSTCLADTDLLAAFAPSPAPSLLCWLPVCMCTELNSFEAVMSEFWPPVGSNVRRQHAG